MVPRANIPVDDRPCPLPFVVTAAFASGLIWLWVVLQHFALR